jgi:hypothetical protein
MTRQGSLDTPWSAAFRWGGNFLGVSCVQAGERQIGAQDATPPIRRRGGDVGGGHGRCLRSARTGAACLDATGCDGDTVRGCMVAAARGALAFSSRCPLTLGRQPFPGDGRARHASVSAQCGLRMAFPIRAAGRSQLLADDRPVEPTRRRAGSAGGGDSGGRRCRVLVDSLRGMIVVRVSCLRRRRRPLAPAPNPACRG